MKTPAKKATKAPAKASAKNAAPSKKVSAKPTVKAKALTAKAKTPVKATAPAKAKTPVKAKAPAKAKTPSSAKAKPASVSKAKPSTPAPKSGKSAPVSRKAIAPVPKAAVSKASSPKPAATKTRAAQKSVAKTSPVKAVNTPQAVAAKKQAPVAKPSKAPAEVGVPASKAPVASKSTPPSTPAPAPAVPPTTPDLPVRSSRPSARLAQITVPSMPQAVASTAAKASFLPQMTPHVLPVTAAPSRKDPKLAHNWKSKPVDQLSDAEVLAMPDGEYMNEVQMAFFRLKLVQLKRDILNNAGETTEHLREDTVVVPDPADRATIEEEHALELRTRDRERKLLKKIEQSIARIDAGDYGYCDETGEPIGVGRLLARPTATLSLEAQQRRELKQKMFGD